MSESEKKPETVTTPPLPGVPKDPALRAKRSRFIRFHKKRVKELEREITGDNLNSPPRTDYSEYLGD